jgi:hypothetical protein
MLFLIAYAGKNKRRIEKALAKMGANEVLDSAWIYPSEPHPDINAATLRDTLLSSIDSTDKLVVVEISGHQTAWHPSDLLVGLV